MTNEELINSARICSEDMSCEGCAFEGKDDFCHEMRTSPKLISQLADALEQAIKERDAAMEEIIARCENCKYLETPLNSNQCANCSVDFSNWEWRGVKE